MQIRVLGPVDIRRDDRVVPVVGEKQRTLLALFVLRANRIVPHEDLLTALWGDRQPPTGRRALHNHLWSLRRALGDDAEISTSAGGYALVLPAHASDLALFRSEVASAGEHRLRGDVAETAERLRVALALWRGPALAGTRLEFQSAEGHRLEDQRIAALAERIDADLALGRHADLIGEVRHLVDADPLNERFREQLMLALYRDGRRAEALEQYRLARTCLRDELGLEPGEPLNRLHQAVLAADPALRLVQGAPSPGRTPEQPPERLVPRQLPADIARFTGRRESLDVLDELLDASPDMGTLVLSALVGAGGVGKTALATHWGHRRADHFPDGQLYVNLHGYSRSTPVDPAAALHQLLLGLGVPQDEIPYDPEERAAMYRSLICDRRMLVLLDNAASAEQVRPLLPGASASRTLITSRDSLRALAATHDVGVHFLDVLSPEEAVALLRALLGDEQDHDRDTIGELALLCGRLPLALRLAAAHVRGREAGAARDLVARLRAGDRLTALDISEDPHIGVRATFGLSYQALPESARSVFRSLGLHPGPDLSMDALTTMVGLDREAAREAVDILVRAHLVHRDARQRLTVHDLIREYARELALAQDGHRPALTRLLDWHAHTARAAMAFVDPTSALLHPSVPPPPGGVRRFDERDEAMAWLSAEHRNTVALILLAAHDGWPVHAWQLAYITAYHFHLMGYVDDWIATHRAALRAVRQLGDRNGEAKVLTTLGHALLPTDQYDEFLECQRRAVELAVLSGDRATQAEALFYVAYGLYRTRELPAALDTCTQAFALYRENGDHAGEIAVTDLLGKIYVRLGDMPGALTHLNVSLEWLRRRGRRYDEAYTLMEMGTAHAGLGNLDEALRCHREALRISRDIGNREGEAEALRRAGGVEARQGRFADALRAQEEGLVLARQLPGRLLECRALNSLGGTCHALGDHEAAVRHHSGALEIAEKIKDPYEMAAARDGLERSRPPR
ncbi:tetratricopeptide repeat protein [Nonomuraea mesophila]|uniref:Tetratricopeptide repeat protein n=1 Tax=Nonomuraea mesophila TaxID=2530382 RepID=A0A4R5FT25_9ACTN|nr:BTAD domain-containing putative transcriptional regulator [Nonomuraea mesophila]TDE56124.1 tetratricopeptide repeat protein [Nonomuraea mesophila]